MGYNKDSIHNKYILEFEGSLTIYEVIDIGKKFSNLLLEYDVLELNLNSLQECDVAGIQLLYSAKNTARVFNKEFLIINIPDHLKELIDKTGLDAKDFIQ